MLLLHTVSLVRGKHHCVVQMPVAMYYMVWKGRVPQYMRMLQVTYYEFQKEEVDAAMEGHKRNQRSLTHVPSRVENKEAFNILMVSTHLLITSSCAIHSDLAFCSCSTHEEYTILCNTLSCCCVVAAS